MILTIVLAGSLSWLALAIARDRIEHRSARISVEALSAFKRDQIFEFIEQSGNAPSKGFIGLFDNLGKADGHLNFVLPLQIGDFPWAGKMVEAVAYPPGCDLTVEFRIHDLPMPSETDPMPAIRWLAVPSVSVGTERKRNQSVFSVNRYLQLCPALGEKLVALHPRNPMLMLEMLLAADGQEPSTEPHDQLRCGLSAGWVQSPRFHKCPVCRRPLRLILQVPGVLLSTRIAEGCFYLFCCPSHADQTVQDEDWS